MDKKYVDENIYYIEDFISHDDIIFFIKSLDKEYGLTVADGSGPHVSYMFEHESKANILWREKYIPKIYENIVDDGDFYINDTNPLWIIKYKENFSFSNEKPSKEAASWIFPPHADAESYVDGKPVLTKGWVIYLTDQYEGGELVYINKKISLKPKAGTLIVHPGTKDYEHGVKKFFNGQRIVISGFNHKKQ